MMKKKRVFEILGAAPDGKRRAALSALVAAGLLLAGCGQKGPLMLPSAAPAKLKTPAPDVAGPPPAHSDNTPAAPR